MIQKAETSPATSPQKGPGSRVRFQSIVRTVGMAPILILLCLLFEVLSIVNAAGSWGEAINQVMNGHFWDVVISGRFASGQNLSIVAQQAAVNMVLAAGMTFVILTGGIDLSVGSILAASAMVALIVSNVADLWWLAIPTAVIFGLVFGMANGALVAYLRLPPFIVTLGALTAVRGVARLIGDDKTVFNADLQFAIIGNGAVYGVPWLVIIAFAVILASWFVLRRTVLGVHIYAVGGNEDAARLSGIKVPLVLLFVYGASGALAGLGAVMQAARLYAANGLQLGQSYELDAIAAVILGGTSFVGGIGSIWGTLIGALIIAVLSNGLVLIGISDIWQFIIKGLVIIGAVALDRYRLSSSART
ncbi:MAG: ribose ABC transporter permease [Ancalomicrobiaceae bacterium]|nr:ribose ABC transporter permease [Ancalomicrobiaceae bacterium]